MKNLKKQLIGLMINLFVINACKTELTEIEIPYENRLVVVSFISPQDTILSVRVTNTQPISGQTDNRNILVENAKVQISNGPKTVLLKYDKDGYYRIIAKELPINIGTVCTLKVSVPNGLSTEGTCTIPTQIIKSEDIITEVSAVSNGQVEFRVKWKDFPNQVNYYGIRGAYETESPKCNYNLPYLITDKSNDGQLLVWGGNSAIICVGNGNPNFIVILSSYDSNGSQFFSTSSEQKSVSGVPFTDPVLVYSNMKGAYGVFSAYNQTRIVLKMF